MSVFGKIHDITADPHRQALEWKSKTGGKVIGYLCSNIPEELIYAAGILPVRLLGANEPEYVTRPYIFQSGFCSFARDCFAQALQRRYQYVDGIVFSHCCPHAREIFLDWKRHVPIDFTHEIHAPMLQQSPHARQYLITELEEFLDSLEQWTKKKISTKDIDETISIYNRNRRLMAEIIETMKSDSPKLTEAEIAEVALAGMLMDKREHNLLMDEVLQEISRRPLIQHRGPRLMLLGSVNNNIELLKFIDSLGAQVVIDDYCTGNRYYQTEIIPQENRLASIAERLINKPPCPLHDLPERRRLTHYRDLIEQFRIQGAIYTMQRQCDAHGLDYPAVESLFKEKHIPILKLELDYTVPVGQFRTRIEAFLEMLSAV